MSTWQSSYSVGDLVEILVGFAGGGRWVPGKVSKRSAGGTILVLLDGYGRDQCQVADESDIRLVGHDPLAKAAPTITKELVAGQFDLGVPEERTDAWSANVRSVLTIQNELDPLRVAMMERDVHKLRAVADALAQAVQALVMNAQYLEETEGKAP
jgi:hypothetical protein